MDTFLLDTLLRPFLAEDLEHGDITTEAIFAPSDQARAGFIARHPMTVVGMATVATRVFQLLDPSVRCTDAVADGTRVETGAELLTLEGCTRTLLRGEFWAGITVGLMLVPQGVAYAQLAGLPPITFCARRCPAKLDQRPAHRRPPATASSAFAAGVCCASAHCAAQIEQNDRHRRAPQDQDLP